MLLAVAVACAGSFAFGFNLSIINGPLETIATELGIAGNKALMGLVGGGWAQRDWRDRRGGWE